MMKKAICLAIIVVILTSSAIIVSKLKISEEILTFSSEGDAELLALDNIGGNILPPNAEVSAHYYNFGREIHVNKVKLNIKALHKNVPDYKQYIRLYFKIKYRNPLDETWYTSYSETKTILTAKDYSLDFYVNATGEYLMVGIASHGVFYINYSMGYIVYSDIPQKGNPEIHSFSPVRKMREYTDPVDFGRATVYNMGYPDTINYMFILNPNTDNEVVFYTATMGMNQYPDDFSTWDVMMKASSAELPSPPVALSLGIVFWAGDYGDYTRDLWKDPQKSRIWTCLVGNPENWINVNPLYPLDNSAGLKPPVTLKVHVATDYYEPEISFTVVSGVETWFSGMLPFSGEADVEYTFNLPENRTYEWYVTVYSEGEALWDNSDNPWTFDTNQNLIPPVASADGPYFVDSDNRYVTLDGSASYDTDGVIMNWKWYVWNGNYWQFITDNEKYTTKMFSFYPDGTYDVKLVVVDNSGLNSTDYTNVYVNIQPDYYNLSINVIPENAGAVETDPQPPYLQGTVVTLTATPSQGYVFDHWEGDAIGSAKTTTVTMDSNKYVTAVFSLAPPEKYTLTIDVYPSEGGWVDVTPSGNVYDAGTTVTLTAYAKSGYVFDHWEGDITGDDTTATLTMDSDKQVTAVFKKTVFATGYALIIAGVTIAIAGGIYLWRRRK